MIRFSFKYADGTMPSRYRCRECRAHGVRLYRRYNTRLNQQRLYCRECAIKQQPDLVDSKLHASEHIIGNLVAAVPTEDGRTYWGFSSVPDAGVAWWERLPKGATAGK